MIGIIIAALVLIFVAVLLIRTVTLKPTAAKTAKVELDTSARAEKYGKELAALVRHETISSRYDDSREKFYKMHETLETMFPNIHAKCEKHVFNGSLLFKWEGKKNHDPILFMSHHDVVEAGGKWEHEPFSGDIDEKGRVWGRGTVDTKASLFCMLTAVEELIAEGYEPECDVYIASSCTEESGGDGAPATVRYLKENGVRLAFVMDEGGMIIEEPIAGVKGVYGMVGVVEKGYGDLKFIARSGGGHASAPKKNTPLVRLGKFMADMDKKSPFTAKLTPTVKEMFRRTAPNMNFGMKLIFANIEIFAPLLEKLLPSISSAAGAMIRTTLAFTTAKGSDGLNVLPQEAYVTGNMRFIQHQDAKESIELISNIAKKYDLETEVLYNGPACPIVDYKSNAFGLVEKVADEVYPGVQICPYVMTGGSDARFFDGLTDQCIRFLPFTIDAEQLDSIHGINEYVSTDTLVPAVDFYRFMYQNV